MASPNTVGLVIGGLIGGWHLLWSLLVLLDWAAQPVIDFIFWAQMIQPIYVVEPFDPLAAIIHHDYSGSILRHFNPTPRLPRSGPCLGIALNAALANARKELLFTSNDMLTFAARVIFQP